MCTGHHAGDDAGDDADADANGLLMQKVKGER
jgi:hypothetical protein